MFVMNLSLKSGIILSELAEEILIESHILSAIMQFHVQHC